MTNHFENVAICARAESIYFNLELAKELAARGDCKLYLYCSHEGQVALYKSLPEASLFETIENGGFLLETALESVSDPDAILRCSKELEDRLGYPIATISVANRHLGRGFSLAGFYHPRSRYSEQTSHIQMLNAYNKVLSFWDREYSEKRISLLVNGYKEAACMSRVHGIPYRAMAASRHRNLHYWAWNEHSDNPLFAGRYHAMEADNAGDSKETLDAPYYTHQVTRKNFLNDIGFRSFLKRYAMTLVRFAYWKMRGSQNARGYTLRGRLGMEVRRWRDYRKVQNCARDTVEELKKRPYVYYPLHVEPEAGLQLVSPEYLYQLALITAVARDLPAEAIVAVKEAYGSIGRRPDNFYDQILEFKNVTMFKTMEWGIECAQNAAAVVTISGTAGLEAAVAGVPVVSFGHHNLYNVLPHVQVVDSERELVKYLKKAIAGGFSKPEMIRDGQRLLKAIVEESFDMRKYNYIDLKEFDRQSVVDAYAALVRSVNDAKDPLWQ